MKKSDIISRFSRDLCLAAIAFGVTLPVCGGNVEKDVINSAADLGVAAAYSPTVLPATTNDVTFPSGTAYANPTTLTVLSANITMGTLNELNATALTISGPNSGTTARTLTLNGGGDAISGSQPMDLIYLTNGASLTIQDGTAKTLGVVLAAGADSGNLDVASNAALTIKSILSGNDNLNKTGLGTLTLSGANTFGAGKTFTLVAGALNINTNAALGSATTTNQINGGTTINNTSGAAILTANANPLTINGDFTFAGGGAGTDHDLSFKAAATTLGTAAGASRAITVAAANSTLEIKGVITNGATANALAKAGAGALTLSGNNTFTGGIILNSGTLNINNVGVAGTSGPLGNGGTFTINSGTIDNTSAGAKVLLNVNPITIVSNLAFSTAAGTALNNLTLPGPVSLGADQTLTLNGAGALTLSGVLTNTGDSARTLTVTNGATATTFGSLTLGGFALTGAGSTAARTNTINGTGNVTISGAVSDGVSAGSGLTYSGAGTLALSGANTFGGLLAINSGTVTVSGNSTGTDGVTLNGGTLNINAAGVAGASGPLGNGGTLTINGGTLIDNTSGAAKVLLNVNPITIGGDFAYSTSAGTANNSLSLPGNISLTADRTITVNGAGTLALISGSNSTLSSGSSGLKTLAVSGAGNLSLGGNSAALMADGSGQLGITMAGTGILTMGGQNTFTGDLLVKSGIAKQNSTSAGSATSFGAGTIRLGDTNAGNANATLQLTVGGSGITYPNPIIVQAGNSGTKTINNSAGNFTATLGGRLTLNDDLTLVYSGGAGGHITLGSSATAEALTGMGNLSFSNNGVASHVITGNNSNFTGRVTIQTGALLVNSTTSLNSNNSVAVDSLSNAPTFNLYGNNQTIAGLNDGPNGGGTVTNTGAAKTLTLGGNGVYSFSGSIGATNFANLALTVALTGGGSQTLGGTNTFTGATTISNGTLLVNGSLSSTSVTVNAGATLGGSGILAGTTTVKSNGILAPGSVGTVGTLTVSNLMLQSGAVYNWEYGTGTSDSVAVFGTLTVPTVATVNVTRVNGRLPQTALLFTTPNSVSANLNGWVIRGDGTAGGRIASVGNNVVLSFPYHGAAVFFR